jgi:CheY-like chemotaxis protein
MFDVGAANMDPEMGAAYLSTLYRTRFCRSSTEEVEALAISNAEDSPGSLGDIPLIVLTADTSEADLLAQIPPYLKSVVGPEVIRKVFEVNEEMQKGFVALSSQGRQIMVPNSGHVMQVDQPGMVIDALRNVIAQVRGE